MKKTAYFIIGLIILCFANDYSVAAQSNKVKIVVLTERGGQHESFTAAALRWLDSIALIHHYEIHVLNDTRRISDAYLSDCKVFIQLDYPPYNWTDQAKSAFMKYMDEGKGGWVGFHHATLLGDFDGFPMWNWFSDFMGGIRFANYIAETASGKVYVEDRKHPVMKGVSEVFLLQKDEWYTFDKSPRSKVHVLAHVDESSYQPASNVKMGDHPVVWVNENKKSRNVYFLMGHHAVLFESESFRMMFLNAITWILSE